MADYITRHEALRTLQMNLGDYCSARRALCEIPAADVAPVVHGRWYMHTVPATDLLDNCECSNCGKVAWIMTNYCPNCGARMDGEDGDDNEAADI